MNRTEGDKSLIEIGQRFGPYEVTGRLGEGAMGEVWEARDTRLSRSVAIKLLPADFGGNPDRRARFELEAQALSKLQHPNVCVLHDVGEEEGRSYLVLERLEGETLAERLLRGPLDNDEALILGAQIADGLDAAHRCDLVHRDLKPSNIILTRTGAKILDFGLARDGGAFLGSTGQEGSDTPTLSAEGVIAGTVPYMSPEQLEGRTVDSRSDIFALGAVLYEMTTGRRAFDGDSAAATASAILSTPPAAVSKASAFPGDRRLARVIRRCLAKDAENRFQSARDVGLDLRELALEEADDATGSAAGGGPTAATKWRFGWPWLALAAAGLLASYWIGRQIGSRAQPSRSDERAIERFSIQTPFTSTRGLEFSRDGRSLFLAATMPDLDRRLYRRRLYSDAFEPVPGTDGAFIGRSDEESILVTVGPSPFAGRAVSVDPETLAIQTLQDPALRGSAYRSSDGALFFNLTDGIPSATGGRVRTKDGELETLRDNWFGVGGAGPGFSMRFTATGLELLWENSGQTVSWQGSWPRIIGDRFIAYYREGAVWARRLDTASETVGAELMVAEDLLPMTDFPVDIGSGFDVSSQGTLAYVTSHQATTFRRELVWVTQDGEVSAHPALPRRYERPLFSPDGSRLAIQAVQGSGFLVGYHKLTQWLFESGEGQQIARPGSNGVLNWDRAGERAVFISSDSPTDPLGFVYDLHLQPDLSESEAIALIRSDENIFLAAPAFDRFVAYQTSDPEVPERSVLRRYDLETGDDIELASQLPTSVDLKFDPSGRWLLAGSLGGGLWLLPIDASRPPVQLDLGALAVEGLFSPDGTELYYRTPGQVRVVGFDADTGRVGESRPLFGDTFAHIERLFGMPAWALHPDGRFLMMREADEALGLSITIVRNFDQVLEETLPKLDP